MVTSAPAALTLEWRLFTVDEYHAMTRAGILVKMAAIGPHHLYAINRLNHLFVQRVQEQTMVSVQNPVRLNNRSEPEPDLVLLRPDLDTSRLPGPEDVLLLVEVADSTLETDRAVKLPLYAAAGIAEVWIGRCRRTRLRCTASLRAGGTSRRFS